MTREGAAGRAKGTRPAIPDTISARHTWSDTEKQAKDEERGAKAALRKERKAGLCKDARCQYIVK